VKRGGGVYAWVKAFHVIAAIAWMAGLLYLPRLMVYHCAAVPGSVQSETFKVMERRLLRGIMTPAMILTWGLGLWLASSAGFFASFGSLGTFWIVGKLTAVAALSAFHGWAARWVKDFAADKNRRPARFYRWANELPTVLMIAIVILVIVKPF
jgi:protoporphyrinogen IX oxidase